MKPLSRQIAVVAGATRGAGRGIAIAQGEAGATVYCTGRSVRGSPAGARPETIEETAELVTARGGIGIAVQVDHTMEAQVAHLFERVREEQNGRLDILVNDIWGGDDLTEWGKKFWELNVSQGLRMLERAVHTHIITSRHGVPLMIERGRGLIVEITDGDFAGYRGNLFYDLSKMGSIRLAYAMAADLRDRPGITSLAVSPGFLRSEYMLDHFGVTEANWREAIEKDRHFAHSETPLYVGRAVTALASDPNVHDKHGRVFGSWTLAKEYGFTDADGSRPDWGAYFDSVIAGILERGRFEAPDEHFLLLVRYYQHHLDPRREDETKRIAALLKKTQN
jgi:NAD(P)-dependent dehydrogenase (short-subunit alcohol dehydrogenase family)